MQSVFGRGPSLQLRLLVALLASVALMVADTRLDSFTKVRSYMLSLASPLQYLANVPGQLMDRVSEQVISRAQLQQQSKILEDQLRLLRSDLLTMGSLRKENARLRALLGSPVRKDGRKMVAEIMSVDSNPFFLQVVIDKGSFDGVYEGQPVLNERGVIGQVLHVASKNSQVILISDASHAIPVRIERNDIRAIAEGSGELDRLQLRHIPRSTDVKVGDRLVTSGLGGRFPEGYPVAIVSRFDYIEGKPYADLEAKPIVNLDRLRYLLLLWPDPEQRTPTQKGVNAQ
jgi:rod shape-determining protein MreC